MRSETADTLTDAFFRQLVECACVAVVAVNTDLLVVSCNQWASKVLGRDASTALGQPLKQFIPSERHNAADRLCRRCIRDQRMVEFEISLQLPDNLVKSLMIVVSPILQDGQTCVGLSLWIRDISNRKKLQQQLQQAERLGSLGTLAGGVAHHFNNILSGAATMADFALACNDPKAMRNALVMTSEAAARVSKLTSSLLSFAQRGTPRGDLADLTEAILTFAALNERNLMAANYVLELELSALPIQSVPPERIHTVLENLLANSREAMPDGGRIRVQLLRRGDDAVLRFIDEGTGIPESTAPMIFEPFFTTKSSDSTNHPGLGLAVAHGIVHQMGGTISLHHDDDAVKGTTIEISLPLKSGNQDDLNLTDLSAST